MIWALGYLVSIIVAFTLTILHERKGQYLDIEALGVILFVCVLWPLYIVCWAIVKFFNWLEKVVNK